MSSTSQSKVTKPRYPKRKRVEVKYYDVESESDASTDYEENFIVKRARTDQTRKTKPRPKNKIFPFLSLPAELRNRIYEECLPEPTKVHGLPNDAGAIWFDFKHRQYRRTFEYVPSIADNMIDSEGGLVQYGNGLFAPLVGTQRGHGGHQASPDADNTDDGPSEPKRLGLNILAVCRQIYDEAAPMVYKRNLVFTGPEALFSFASVLSPRTAKLLRHIEIMTWGMTRSRKTRGYTTMAMLAAKGVTELEKLHIHCEMAWFHSYSWRNKNREIPVPKRVARRVYRDCYLWLETVGSVSGDFYKGIDVLKINEGMFQNGTSSSPQNQEELVATMKMYKKELRRLMAIDARIGAL